MFRVRRSQVILKRNKKIVSRFRALIASYEDNLEKLTCFSKFEQQKRDEILEKIEDIREDIESDPDYPTVARRNGSSRTNFHVDTIKENCENLEKSFVEKEPLRIVIYGTSQPSGYSDPHSVYAKISVDEAERILDMLRQDKGTWWTGIIEKIKGLAFDVSSEPLIASEEVKSEIASILDKMEDWDEVKE